MKQKESVAVGFELMILRSQPHSQIQQAKLKDKNELFYLPVLYQAQYIFVKLLFNSI
jgi:hypothetical protein